jgi:hypothetical protein
MPERLKLPPLDSISDGEWHFTVEGAVKIVNAHLDTPLLLNHWESVDALDFSPLAPPN